MSEEQFPTTVSFGASGGPVRPTQVVKLRSGYEHRNQPWEGSLRHYQAELDNRNYDDLSLVQDFWERHGGPLEPFRWKDWADFKSSKSSKQPVTPEDQIIGTGDGATQTFSLTKAYTLGTLSYMREITKPVAGTVIASVNGQETSNGVVDHVNGTVFFFDAPPPGATITAGFEFDVPVRFSDDSISTVIEYYDGGAISGFDVQEIRVTSEPLTQQMVDNLNELYNTYGVTGEDAIYFSNIVDYTVNTHWGQNVTI